MVTSTKSDHDYRALGLAGIWGSVHVLRIMINRGLVSPNEVDEVFEGIMDGLEGQISVSQLKSNRLFKLYLPRCGSGQRLLGLAHKRVAERAPT